MKFYILLNDSILNLNKYAHLLNLIYSSHNWHYYSYQYVHTYDKYL